MAVAVWALVATWSLSIGRYGGPDEPAHVVRAAAVGRGQLGGDVVPTMASGFRVVDTPAALATGTPSCYRHDARTPATCADATAASGTVRVATAAGINPPTYYAAIGAPVRWFGDPADTTWYRLVAATWTAAWVLVAAFAARPLPRRQRLAFAAVVPPAAWFLGAVVNPSAWEIAACAVAWIGVARAVSRRDAVAPADAAWIGCAAALAITVRSVAVLWVATMAAVLVAGTWRRVRWTRRTVGLVVVPVVVALAAVSSWNRWIGLTLRDDRTAVDDGLLTRLRTSLRGTRETAREMVAMFGWSEYSAPAAVQILWWSMALALAVAVWRRGRRQRVTLLAWACGVVLGPVAFEVATAGDVGYIWQGRYTIPVVLGLAALLAVGDRSEPAARWSSRRTVPGVITVLATAEIVTYWSVLRRATVGTGGSWWLTPSAGSWSPVLDARVLLVAHAAVAFVLAAALVHTTARTSDPTPTARPMPIR